MKRFVILFVVFLFANQSFAQTFSYPEVKMKTENDVFIKEVKTSNYLTEITFVYKNNEEEGNYIYLNPPGHKDAYYIKANGLKYKLLGTKNISNVDEVTAVMPGNVIEFSAKFQKIPSNISQFDLIEGASGEWNFYGIQLKESETSTNSVSKFRNDYNNVAIYNPKTKSWGEWKKGDNTFVININEKGDIAHLKANGETVIYKKLSGVEEGYTEKDNEHYQIIKALDENGDVFRFQLFDDPTIGLKMMWGELMIQFAKW